jgi:hypothetical protein
MEIACPNGTCAIKYLVYFIVKRIQPSRLSSKYQPFEYFIFLPFAYSETILKKKLQVFFIESSYFYKN